MKQLKYACPYIVVHNNLHAQLHFKDQQKNDNVHVYFFLSRILMLVHLHQKTTNLSEPSQ